MEVFKCKNCGSSQYEKQGKKYICKYCGNVIETLDEHSENGTKFEDIEKEKAESQHKNLSESIENVKNNPVQWLILKLILCVFVGWIGVHKFLEQKFVIGVIYLCTGGLFGIGVLIDTIGYIIELASYSRGQGN